MSIEKIKNKNIELLRIISIIFVFLFHMNIDQFKNGYIGVDVFFVISGFVISQSIDKSLKEKSFAILNFYKKRALRLLPELYLMLLTVGCFSCIFDAPHITKNIGQAIIATTTYLSNIFYYTEIDYFNQFHNSSPLLHTWSLSVEEQFYFIFPIILYLITPNLKFNRIIWFLLFLLSITFYFIETDVLFRFYYPQFRFWELLLGSLCYFYLPRITISPTYWFLLLFFSVLFFTGNTLIIFTLISTSLVLLSKEKNQSSIQKQIIFMGSLTYPFYLWHQPVIYYVQDLFNLTAAFEFAVCLSLTIFFTILSYILITKIFTNFKKLSLLAFVTIISLILGYYMHYSNGCFKFKHQIWGMELRNIDRARIFKARHAFWTATLNKPTTDSTILIIGDSKGEDILVALSITNQKRYLFIKCQTWNYDSLMVDTRFHKYIQSKKIQYVIFSNTWKSSDLTSCSETINRVSKIKSTIVLSTCNFEDVFSLLFSMTRKGISKEEAPKFLFNSIRQDWKIQSDNLRSLLDLKTVTWLNKEDAFCSNSKCYLYDSTNLYIFDTGHVTIDGAKKLGSWFNKALISITK